MTENVHHKEMQEEVYFGIYPTIQGGVFQPLKIDGLNGFEEVGELAREVNHSLWGKGQEEDQLEENSCLNKLVMSFNAYDHGNYMGINDLTEVFNQYEKVEPEMRIALKEKMGNETA